MFTRARRNIGSMVMLASILLTISSGLSNTACASAGPNRSRLPQLIPPDPISEVIPGSWEKVHGLQSGSRLIVTLKSGDRFAAAFKALAPLDLILTDPTGNEVSVARSDVATILAQIKDGLANGALIGAGIGFGASLGVLAIIGSQDGYVLPSAKWGAPVLLSGIGSLVGLLVDRARTSRELIFRASA